MNNQPYNIAHQILSNLHKDANKVVFETKRGPMTAGRFANMIISFGIHLQHRGVKQGSIIGLDCVHGPVGYALTLASTLNGATWVNVNKAVVNAKIHMDIVVHNSPKEIIGENIHKISPEWFKAPEGFKPPVTFPGYMTEDDVWMIAQSSGTTGSVKFMPITYKQWFSRATDLERRKVRFPGQYGQFCSLYHPLKSTSQSDVQAAILNGTKVLLTFPSFTDMMTVKDLVVMGSLSQMEFAIKNIEEPATPIDTSINLNGSAVSAQQIDRFLKYFKSVWVEYGATETTKTAMKPITDAGTYNGSVGSILPGTAYRIIDDEGNDCEEGQLLLKTDGMITGYMFEPELTAEHFKDGWFYTGDIATYTDGELFLKGRQNDSLNIGGVKIDPAKIDAVLKEVPGIKDAMTFQNLDFPTYNQLQALIVTDGDQKAIGDAAASAMMEKFGMTRLPRRVFFVNSIPTNENGKPMRKEAAESVKGQEPVVIINYKPQGRE
jgi:acyl-CoA synthetase (AMP-forming)/AMP-acid ligase II